MASLGNNVLAMLTCSHCRKLYRNPIILSACNHTFCLECVQTFVDNSGSVSCPECNQVSVLGPRGISSMRPNLQLERVIQSISGNNLQQSSSLSLALSAPDISMDTSLEVDDVCDHFSNPAKTPILCLHCSRQFCKTCFFVHAERIKVEIFEMVKGENSTVILDEIKQFLNEKADVAKKLSLEGLDSLKAILLTSIEGRKTALQLHFDEVVKEKLAILEKTIAAAQQQNLANLPEVQEIVQELSLKSVLTIAPVEIADKFTRVSAAAKKHSPLVAMKTSLQNLSRVTADDGKFAEKLLEAFKTPLPEIEWCDGSGEREENETISKAHRQLHAAIEAEDLKAVCIVLDQPWSHANLVHLIEKRDSDDRTALIHAVNKGNLEIVRYLVKNSKADVSATFGEGKVTAAHLAASNGQLEIMRELILRNVSLCSVRDRFGASPLCHAAYMGHAPICSLLLEYAETNKENEGENKRTPLLYAATGGHRSVVELLHKAGVNMRARDGHRMTALHLASYFGYPAIVRYLMRIQPDLIDEKNMYDQTALAMAVANDKPDVVALIRDHGRGKK